ncbi:hypothetical protein BESB_001430 [Besnoitia besnoiti]|uniref:Uncharacterized protein n=1 Tax=Besnoitia besnoiti TaxID=94643 RepID=A0A2A9MMV5_BESBE|nr:hypothetical protein BESB_001430 [Besnoitia besnoiti]PFH37801.1 hypothetical protein BESB_001430 [Besnoitia besnoiti]
MPRESPSSSSPNSDPPLQSLRRLTTSTPSRALTPKFRLPKGSDAVSSPSQPSAESRSSSFRPAFASSSASLSCRSRLPHSHSASSLSACSPSQPPSYASHASPPSRQTHATPSSLRGESVRANQHQDAVGGLRARGPARADASPAGRASRLEPNGRIRAFGGDGEDPKAASCESAAAASGSLKRAREDTDRTGVSSEDDEPWIQRKRQPLPGSSLAASVSCVSPVFAASPALSDARVASGVAPSVSPFHSSVVLGFESSKPASGASTTSLSSRLLSAPSPSTSCSSPFKGVARGGSEGRSEADFQPSVKSLIFEVFRCPLASSTSLISCRPPCPGREGSPASSADSTLSSSVFASRPLSALVWPCLASLRARTRHSRLPSQPCGSCFACARRRLQALWYSVSRGSPEPKDKHAPDTGPAFSMCSAPSMSFPASARRVLTSQSDSGPLFGVGASWVAPASTDGAPQRAETDQLEAFIWCVLRLSAACVAEALSASSARGLAAAAAAPRVRGCLSVLVLAFAALDSLLYLLGLLRVSSAPAGGGSATLNEARGAREGCVGLNGNGRVFAPGDGDGRRAGDRGREDGDIESSLAAERLREALRLFALASQVLALLNREELLSALAAPTPAVSPSNARVVLREMSVKREELVRLAVALSRDMLEFFLSRLFRSLAPFCPPGERLADEAGEARDRRAQRRLPDEASRLLMPRSTHSPLSHMAVAPPLLLSQFSAVTPSCAGAAEQLRLPAGAVSIQAALPASLQSSACPADCIASAPLSSSQPPTPEAWSASPVSAGGAPPPPASSAPAVRVASMEGPCSLSSVAAPPICPRAAAALLAFDGAELRRGGTGLAQLLDAVALAFRLWLSCLEASGDFLTTPTAGEEAENAGEPGGPEDDDGDAADSADSGQEGEALPARTANQTQRRDGACRRLRVEGECMRVQREPDEGPADFAAPSAASTARLPFAARVLRELPWEAACWALVFGAALSERQHKQDKDSDASTALTSASPPGDSGCARPPEGAADTHGAGGSQDARTPRPQAPPCSQTSSTSSGAGRRPPSAEDLVLGLRRLLARVSRPQSASSSSR